MNSLPSLCVSFYLSFLHLLWTRRLLKDDDFDDDDDDDLENFRFIIYLVNTITPKHIRYLLFIKYL